MGINTEHAALTTTLHNAGLHAAAALAYRANYQLMDNHSQAWEAAREATLFLIDCQIETAQQQPAFHSLYQQQLKEQAIQQLRQRRCHVETLANPHQLKVA